MPVSGRDLWFGWKQSVKGLIWAADIDVGQKLFEEMGGTDVEPACREAAWAA